MVILTAGKAANYQLWGYDPMRPYDYFRKRTDCVMFHGFVLQGPFGTDATELYFGGVLCLSSPTIC